MTRPLRAAVFLGLVSTLATFATPPARADDETLSKCIAASDQALDLRKQGHLLRARQALAECASPSCGPEISDTCQKGIAELNELLPTIIFVPKNGAGDDVAGVKLYVDGAPYAERLDGSAVTIDPGEHEFRFEVAGQPPVTKRFVLREREPDRREEILIGPPAPPRPAALGSPNVVLVDSHAPEPPTKLDSTGSVQRTVATLLLAVALPVGGIVSLSFGGAAVSSWNSAQNECNSACGPKSQAQSDLQSARSSASKADVAFAATAVVLVGGIVLRTTAPARRPIPSTAATVGVAPALNDRGGGLLVTGSFL